MQYSKTDLAVTKQVTGASLIEVLVALIIFSIGVLGIVGLQLSAANNSQINNHFIQARLITDNLAGRITLNKNAVITSLSLGILPSNTEASNTLPLNTQAMNISSEYFSAQSYDLALYGSCQDSYYRCFCQQVPAQIPNCRATSCTPAQLAQFDTYEVACMLALMSNLATIQIYSTVINTDTFLLSINLIWPAQSLFVQNQSSNNKTNQTPLSFSAVNSDCSKAIQDLGVSVNSFMCYSQSLVIAAIYYDS